MAVLDNRAVAGSWEAQLERAGQLAANDDDGCIPLLEKIIGRLSKVSRSQRMAADFRLQNILVLAIHELIRYRLMHEEYDEALALLDVIDATYIERGEGFDSLEAYLLEQSTLILLQAGRTDEGMAILQEAIDSAPDIDLDDWLALARAQLACHQWEAVAESIAQMHAWIETRYEGDEAPDARRYDRAAVAKVEARLLMERGQVEAGVARFRDAIKLHPASRDEMPEVCARLAGLGAYDEVLRLIEGAREPSTDLKFWQGYAYHQLGKTSQAHACWQAAVAMDPDDAEENPDLEWYLARYYLGDPKSAALTAAMYFLTEDLTPHWVHFLLAGLGWALRGKWDHARDDVRTAMRYCRADLGGRLLPARLWIHFEALLPADKHDQFARYFAQSSRE